MPTWSSLSSPEPKYWRSRSLTIGIDAAAHRDARLALPAGRCPRRAVAGDLLGLELVEGHAGVLDEQGGAHQVHALLGRPLRGRAGARAPPDAVGQARRLRLDGQPAAHPAGHPRVGVDHGRPGERGPEQRGLLTGEVGVARPLRRHVAERLRAAQRRLRRSPAHAELQPTVAEQVRRGGLLGHVQRVLVAHVDDAGADLDAARSARPSPSAAGTARPAAGRSGAPARRRRPPRAPRPRPPARRSARARRDRSAPASPGWAASARRTGTRSASACTREQPAGRRCSRRGQRG